MISGIALIKNAVCDKKKKKKDGYQLFGLLFARCMLTSTRISNISQMCIRQTTNTYFAERSFSVLKSIRIYADRID